MEEQEDEEGEGGIVYPLEGCLDFYAFETIGDVFIDPKIVKANFDGDDEEC